MTCAFAPCIGVADCAMVGGCVERRFGPAPTRAAADLKDGARALAGTKPARTNRDPARIKRRRKVVLR